MKIDRTLLISLLYLLVSCNSLDIENTESYDANKVWDDEKLANANLVHIYANTFHTWELGADVLSEQQSGMFFHDSFISSSSSFEKKWHYSLIRQINEGIVNLGKGHIDSVPKARMIGELLFMRAYLYFEMLTYHGGIPYITKPQDKNNDDLFVKRNSSKECFDFIIKDLDNALSCGLSDRISKNDPNYGRIDHTFIKAFKAKVLLQKASPQFNPTNPYDNQYWNEAYDAAKEAFEYAADGGVKLMTEYRDVWIKGGTDENIFTVLLKFPITMSYYEQYSRPNSLSSGSVAGNHPTWNFIQDFPMRDGKRYDDPAGKYFVKNEQSFMQKYWENRDERFEYSILYSGKLYPVKGQRLGYRQYSALGIANIGDNYGKNPNAGTISNNNDILSSFYVLKGTNMSLSKQEVGTFENDYPLMRYPELMLIYAETANEVGKSEVAIEMLKQIRKRAKIEAGSDNNYGLTDPIDRKSLRDAILAERNIELCFEGHRYLDLRRTRNLHKLSGLKKYGLESVAIDRNREEIGMEVWEIPELNMREAKRMAEQYQLTPSDFKYIKHQLPANTNSNQQYGTMKDSYYFYPIEQKHIDANSNLLQNKEWGGTFDPTLN